MTKQQLFVIDRIMSLTAPCKCGMEQTLEQASDAPDEIYCNNVECDVAFYVEKDGNIVFT